MAIENRNLAVGTKLSVRYKKQLYTAEVVQGEDGIRFRLEDGREFKSPSAAGAAVKGGGKTCDGWKFWSLAGSEQPSPAEPRQKVAKPNRSRTLKNIKKLPNQKGVAEGSTKFFCSSCMKGFVAEGPADPQACPEGHPAVVEDEFVAAVEK
jgi:hypothetical protein